MKLPKREIAILKSTLATEQQAIAIYEAECWWLRKTPWGRRKLTLTLCEEVLQEELLHSKIFAPLVGPSNPALAFLSVASGYLLGTLLCLLPTRLSWRIHVWAEKEARNIYLEANRKIQGPHYFQIKSDLAHAANQEQKHSDSFLRLLHSNS